MTEEFRPLFIEEATEQLAEFQAGVLRLEDMPGDAEAIDVVFRIAHSLKGSSAMMRFTEITQFAHVLESLLDQVRKGDRTVTPEVINVLLASGDVLRNLVGRLEAGPTSVSPEPDEATESVRASIVALLAWPDTAHEREVIPDGRHASPVGAPAPTPYRIDFRPSAEALRRGLDPLRAIGQVAALGKLSRAEPDLDALPPLAELEPEQCYLAWTLTVETTHGQEELEACLTFAAAPDGLRISQMPAAEVVTPTAGQPPRRRASDRDEAAVIRVAVDKVDRLLNLVGELVTTQAMLAQAVTDHSADGIARVQEVVARMERHAQDLHHDVLGVRLVSVKALFARFPRFVRDLAQTTRKQVVVELSGEDTELDKSVIEKIADPLLHLVRNAIDHGLESPADRRASGKTEVGRVGLDAYARGGNVYIEVSDDGRGLDRDRILAHGRAHGLVAAGEVPSNEEIFALIFRPGFSTAETVSEVSGRGVGMDVVMRNVEALGGTITTWTEPGRGTRFRVKLPLTLALLDGQILQVGDQVYVVPLAAISQSVRPARGSVHGVGSAEVVVVHRTPLPLLRLARLFGLKGSTDDPTQGLLVVVEHEGSRMALCVDGLLGQQQVVIKSLETHFRKVDGIAGATVLADGRVSLILDVPGLIGLARRGPRRDAPLGRIAVTTESG